jgi:hypothetical protein
MPDPMDPNHPLNAQGRMVGTTSYADDTIAQQVAANLQKWRAMQASGQGAGPSRNYNAYGQVASNWDHANHPLKPLGPEDPHAFFRQASASMAKFAPGGILGTQNDRVSAPAPADFAQAGRAIGHDAFRDAFANRFEPPGAMGPPAPAMAGPVRPPAPPAQAQAAHPQGLMATMGGAPIVVPKGGPPPLPPVGMPKPITMQHPEPSMAHYGLVRQQRRDRIAGGRAYQADMAQARAFQAMNQPQVGGMMGRFAMPGFRLQNPLATNDPAMRMAMAGINDALAADKEHSRLQNEFMADAVKRGKAQFDPSIEDRLAKGVITFEQAVAEQSQRKIMAGRAGAGNPGGSPTDAGLKPVDNQVKALPPGVTPTAMISAENDGKPQAKFPVAGGLPPRTDFAHMTGRDFPDLMGDARTPEEAWLKSAVLMGQHPEAKDLFMGLMGERFGQDPVKRAFAPAVQHENNLLLNLFGNNSLAQRERARWAGNPETVPGYKSPPPNYFGGPAGYSPPPFSLFR